MSKISIPLLTSEDIEVKVKQITKAGALGLLYKTARVDRRILDQVFGTMNWTSDYKMIDDTLYCGIGIRESVDQDFVWKWDAGGESENSLDDGASAKATASDAFKRAGFAVGIGAELYTSPMIWLDVETVQENGKWKLKDPFAKYVVTHIAYNTETRVITELEITSVKSNVVVFSWKMPTTGALAKKMTNTLSQDKGDKAAEDSEEKPKEKPQEKPSKSSSKSAATKSAQNAPEAAQNAPESRPESSEGNSTSEEKMPLKRLITAIGQMVKKMYAEGGTADTYNAIVKEVTGGNTFKCNSATEDQYDTVLAIYQKLKDGGYEQ